MSQDTRITTIEDLEALYGPIAAPSKVKVVDHIHPVYRPFIEAAPFAVLATTGPAGLDTTPRGDPAGFVHIEDDRTLLLPDRRGNNRIDSLRNIVADPRVALLFLIPGIGETLRVNGTAEILVDPDLLDRFVMAGQVPKSVLRITVGGVFFQCSRAVIRAGLWDPDAHIDRQTLPSPGTILRTLSAAGIDGDAYDRALPQRLADTLY
ncbi:pyridoxamine 5'-phosphate oxidase family protein [Sphingomonas sanguinis]|uniref:Pyridoxamine 5'-phosphate oxidase family protein n=1 Tax=Sphingomonas sanguinis TaxID=33051 RepID=A0ABU5LLF4_9SPHN|nr:pyridoxamine 5'-phosphate oxidase family protein [Sphingomonas sanguinis]MDZ7280758.1 pyridoxamine 5'-phosphate oxidase family protein [Sphingomonas sanguinis]